MSKYLNLSSKELKNPKGLGRSQGHEGKHRFSFLGEYHQGNKEGGLFSFLSSV